VTSAETDGSGADAGANAATASRSRDVDGGPSVVVPAIGAPSSSAVLRSLGGRGIHTIAASEQSTPPGFSSRYCDERVAVPEPSEDLPGYRDALLSLARRDDVETITPVREVDVYTLARHREAFAEHVAPVWPTFDQLETVHDRELLLAAAQRADVPIPETSSLDEIDDWDEKRIVKGRYAILTSEYVDGVPEDRCLHPPKTMYLEPGTEPDVAAITDDMGHVPIAQEYLDGTEFCLRALCIDGDPVVTTQKRLVRGYKYPRGPSVYHEAVDIPRLEEVGLSLLSELDWNGVASVGFIRDSEGTFRLLEINPRLWSSLPMDLHAGVDYPHYVWRVASGESIDETPDYRPGTASHLLRGEVAHLYSVMYEDYPFVERPSTAGTVRDVATSLYRQPSFDLLSLDDPGPFVRDLLNVAGSVTEGSLVGRLGESLGDVLSTTNSDDGDRRVRG
jgi:predicted ATP-grasp superfamily ATP-dependent carboligase